ncbi:hypothetical protein SAMN05216308_11720 [Nitrosospira sp. Nsp13]|nr:hypothetical protein SAMN05216308_11720 [Nitrosospira sp. Nsp13]
MPEILLLNEAVLWGRVTSIKPGNPAFGKVLLSD